MSTWENPDTPIYIRGYADGVAAARIEIIEWIRAQDPLPGGTAWQLLDNLLHSKVTVGGAP